MPAARRVMAPRFAVVVSSEDGSDVFTTYLVTTVKTEEEAEALAKETLARELNEDLNEPGRDAPTLTAENFSAVVYRLDIDTL